MDRRGDRDHHRIRRRRCPVYEIDIKGRTRKSSRPPRATGAEIAPATPIAEKKAELGDDRTWNPEWDSGSRSALPPELLSTQSCQGRQTLLPALQRFERARQAGLLGLLLSGSRGSRSGLVPTANVRHMDAVLQVKDDVTHRMIRQEGLLQLTYMDQERYGCDFDWEKDKLLDEHDPQNHPSAEE